MCVILLTLALVARSVVLVSRYINKRYLPSSVCREHAHFRSSRTVFSKRTYQHHINKSTQHTPPIIYSHSALKSFSAFYDTPLSGENKHSTNFIILLSCLLFYFQWGLIILSSFSCFSRSIVQDRTRSYSVFSSMSAASHSSRATKLSFVNWDLIFIEYNKELIVILPDWRQGKNSSMRIEETFKIETCIKLSLVKISEVFWSDQFLKWMFHCIHFQFCLFIDRNWNQFLI